jgi:hypothetical protein
MPILSAAPGGIFSAGLCENNDLSMSKVGKSNSRPRAKAKQKRYKAVPISLASSSFHHCNNHARRQHLRLSRSAREMAEPISITTFNLLAPCTEALVQCADPQNLAFAQRWPLLKQQLLRFTQGKHILVLQEVDLEIEKQGLYGFLLSQGYICVRGVIVPPRNHATTIAFPSSRFYMQEMGHERIGLDIMPPPSSTPTTPMMLIVTPAHQEWFAAKQRAKQKQLATNGHSNVCFPLPSTLAPHSLVVAPTAYNSPASGPVHYKAFSEARRRNYLMPWVLLFDWLTGECFLVFGFHMSCLFQPTALPIMGLQLEALLRKMPEISRGLPFLLAGDFNFQPDSPLYQFATTGIAPAEVRPFMNFCADSRTRKNPLLDLLLEDHAAGTSTYSSVAQNLSSNGVLTNKTTDFEGRIDYVWGSDKRWQLQQVLVEKLAKKTTLPDETHGSDHIPITYVLDLASEALDIKN